MVAADRRPVLVAFLATIAIASFLPLEERPAAAVGWNFRIHEVNICGNSCYGGDTVPGDVVIWGVAGSNPKPIVVALNEVCFNTDQLGRIQFAMAAEGYVGATVVTWPSGCGSGVHYGNVVFMKGAMVGSPARHTFLHQRPNHPEDRAVVCITTTGFFSWRGCSAHLLNRGGVASQQAERMLIANAQANELLYASSASSLLTITAGDFNLRPHELYSLPTWRSGFEEADEYPPYVPTTGHGAGCNGGSGSKIDFVWVRDFNVTKLNMCTYDLHGRFDHRYLEENFRVEL